VDGIVSLVGVDLLTRQEAKDETAPPEFYRAQVKVTTDGKKSSNNCGFNRECLST
jgi:hypothetical protein